MLLGACSLLLSGRSQYSLCVPVFHFDVQITIFKALLFQQYYIYFAWLVTHASCYILAPPVLWFLTVVTYHAPCTRLATQPPDVWHAQMALGCTFAHLWRMVPCTQQTVGVRKVGTPPLTRVWQVCITALPSRKWHWKKKKIMNRNF